MGTAFAENFPVTSNRSKEENEKQFGAIQRSEGDSESHVI